jgi:hypothetical protein
MGSGVAQIDIKADDGTSFDWTWFVSSTAMAREVLAAALTALATNKHVYVTIGDPVQPFAQVVNFGIAI